MAFSTFSIVLIYLIAQVLSQTTEDDTCVVTATSCPCAIGVSAGVCMQHKGNNKCLMSTCNEGYKCDCLGYEQCSISSCSKYTTLAGVIPSSVTLFSCQSVQGIATCLNVTGLRNGTNAAEAAKLESSQMIKLINAELTAAETLTSDILQKKILVDALIERLDYHNITASERGDINEQALIIVNAFAKAQHELAALQTIMAQAFDHDRQVYGFKRLALERDEQANELRQELAQLQGEASECTTSQCTSLIAQIQELMTQRAEAVVNAGGKAQQARQARGVAVEYKTNVTSIHDDSTTALKSAESQAIDIFARIRASAVSSAQ